MSSKLFETLQCLKGLTGTFKVLKVKTSVFFSSYLSNFENNPNNLKKQKSPKNLTETKNINYKKSLRKSKKSKKVSKKIQKNYESKENLKNIGNVKKNSNINFSNFFLFNWIFLPKKCYSLIFAN